MADRGGIVTLANVSWSPLDSTARNPRRGVVSIKRNDLPGTPGGLFARWFHLTGTISKTAGSGPPSPGSGPPSR